MSAPTQEDEDVISGINVTPLVDIMLVLVIILMVTAEFTRYHTVPVQLPKINAVAVKREPQKVSLTIRKDDTLWWNDKQVQDLNTLLPMLVSAKAVQRDIAVILRAEEKIEYAKILRILDQVKMAGISKVGLAVDAIKRVP